LGYDNEDLLQVQVPRNPDFGFVKTMGSDDRDTSGGPLSAGGDYREEKEVLAGLVHQQFKKSGSAAGLSAAGS